MREGVVVLILLFALAIYCGSAHAFESQGVSQQTENVEIESHNSGLIGDQQYSHRTEKTKDKEKKSQAVTPPEALSIPNAGYGQYPITVVAPGLGQQ